MKHWRLTKFDQHLLGLARIRVDEEDIVASPEESPEEETNSDEQDQSPADQSYSGIDARSLALLARFVINATADDSIAESCAAWESNAKIAFAIFLILLSAATLATIIAWGTCR
jgi:hypothetical protein